MVVRVSVLSASMFNSPLRQMEITSSPSQRFYSDVAIDFEGLIEDTIADNEDIEVQWVSDLDGDFTTENVPSESGLTIASAQLSEGIHEIILTAENLHLGWWVKTVLISMLVERTAFLFVASSSQNPQRSSQQALNIQIWGNAVDPDIPEMNFHLFGPPLLTENCPLRAPMCQATAHFMPRLSRIFTP